MNNTLPLTRLSYVPRWCIVPMDRVQSVAEHSYRVALIAVELVRRKEWSSGQLGLLVLVALTHDANEIHTGDIPATAKHNTVSVVERNPFEWVGGEAEKKYQFIVKVADLVEAITWFNAHESSGPRRTGILGSMMHAFNSLEHHPYYDAEVYSKGRALIESGEIE